MKNTYHVAVIVGSLRKGSHSRQLAHALAALAPEPLKPERVEIKTALDSLGLRSFPKTTGGKGLHVVVPILPKQPWPVVKDFARTFAEFITQRAPDKFVTNMSKSKRKGKIFIDYLRNARGATAVAPYSTRARPGATVSTPLGWDELTPTVDPQAFHVGSLPQRLAALKEDPWRELANTRQSLTMKMLNRIRP